MKNLLLLIILFVALRLPVVAQALCEETVTWFTYFEQGKAQERTKSSEYIKCTDKYGNIIKEREFGEGRVLQYSENTFDAQNRPLKTYYTHGYEGNDGGEGTITYQYITDSKTIINTVTANFSVATEIDIVKNSKGLVIKKEEKEKRQSELLEDYNSATKTSTTYQYSEQDSLLKKVAIIKDSISLRQITELYQYKDNLKARFEYKEMENGKQIKHTVTTYKYDAQKQLIEEKTVELPNYFTTSITQLSYYEGKIKELEKTDYKDFAKKEMSYHETKKFGYDAKGALEKTYLATRYFYEGAFTSFTETQIEMQDDTKKISTTNYNDKNEDKRLTIQWYKGEKIVKTEEYLDKKLSYIYEYEYTIK